MTSVLPRDVEPTELPWFAGWRGTSGCPPPEVLLPSIEGMLPETVARLVRAHLDRCALCRELVETQSTTEVADPSADEIARIDGRIRSAMSHGVGRWVPLAAAAAVILAVGAGYVAWHKADTQSRVSTLSVPVPPGPPAAPAPSEPEFVLAMDKPVIELPPESLILRSGSPDRYAAALERALEPFVRNDYPAAASQLETVVRDYPDRPHPVYYLGISRLFNGAPAEAARDLEHAQRLAGAGTSLYAEAAWYRAVALERIGQPAMAAGALLELCGSGGDRDVQACDGLRTLLKR
jgi:hypothetical protein